MAVSFSDGAIHCMKFSRFPTLKLCARWYFKSFQRQVKTGRSKFKQETDQTGGWSWNRAYGGRFLALKENGVIPVGVLDEIKPFRLLRADPLSFCFALQREGGIVVLRFIDSVRL